jgi:hypothetical protein
MVSQSDGEFDALRDEEERAAQSPQQAGGIKPNEPMLTVAPPILLADFMDQGEKAPIEGNLLRTAAKLLKGTQKRPPGRLKFVTGPRR